MPPQHQTRWAPGPTKASYIQWLDSVAIRIVGTTKLSSFLLARLQVQLWSWTLHWTLGVYDTLPIYSWVSSAKSSYASARNPVLNFSNLFKFAVHFYSNKSYFTINGSSIERRIMETNVENIIPILIHYPGLKYFKFDSCSILCFHSKGGKTDHYKRYVYTCTQVP